MKFVYTLWYLFVASIPFGTRFFLGSVTPGFHEYESFFIYGYDLLLLGLLLGLFLFRSRSLFLQEERQASGALWLLGLILFASVVSLFFAQSVTLSLFVLVRVLILAGVSIFIAPRILGSSEHRICTVSVLVLSGVLQAVVAFLQFLFQRSLSLSILGESTFAGAAPGVSTVFIEGARLVRGYGTFPHPNILAMFLVVSLLGSLYLYMYFDGTLYQWDKTVSVLENAKHFFLSPYFFLRLLLGASFFVISAGLLVAFSRAGWLAAAVSVFLFLVFSWKISWRRSLRTLVLVLASVSVLYYLFLPFVRPRIIETSRTEPSVNYRLIYADIGFEIASDHLFGVGLSNQVLYSVTSGLYQAHGLTRVFEWEPIHSLYLLAITEIGLLGGVSLLLLFLYLFWRLYRHRPDSFRSFSISLLAAVFIFGFFDHFLWDLQPGRMILWFVFGICFSVVFYPRKQDLYR